jgi:Pentapeptide repeats (8 copies)
MFNVASDDRDPIIEAETQVGQDLRDRNLCNLKFRSANFRNADFSGADLRNCNFDGADLSGANFAAAKIGADPWMVCKLTWEAICVILWAPITIFFGIMMVISPDGSSSPSHSSFGDIPSTKLIDQVSGSGKVLFWCFASLLIAGCGICMLWLTAVSPEWRLPMSLWIAGGTTLLLVTGAAISTAQALLRTNFSNANLTGAKFDRATFQQAKTDGAKTDRITWL